MYYYLIHSLLGEIGGVLFIPLSFAFVFSLLEAVKKIRAQERYWVWAALSGLSLLLLLCGQIALTVSA